MKLAREALRKVMAKKQKAEREERIWQLCVNIDMMQLGVNEDNTIQAKYRLDATKAKYRLTS